MAYFDRFDICEAHLALEWDYHEGGILRERPSNIRRNMSTDVQLRRMGFRHGAGFYGFRSLSENGKDIYHEWIMKRNAELLEAYGHRGEEFLKTRLLYIPPCCSCIAGEEHNADCAHDCDRDYCARYEENRDANDANNILNI